MPTLYILFLMVPIYWLLNMSFKTTNEILREFTLWPRNFTLENYHEILTNPVWYNGYINSITYVSHQHGHLGYARHCRLPTLFRATAFSATSTSSSGF